MPPGSIGVGRVQGSRRRVADDVVDGDGNKHNTEDNGSRKSGDAWL
jgi:hypothetical protein